LNRRTALRTLAVNAIGAVAAPAILRGRYQLFAQSQTQYSARTIALVREATVVDMLCQFAFDDFSKSDAPVTTRWRRDPASFTAEHFAMFRDSGVNVLALGSGPNDYESAIRFYAEWNGFIASHSNWFTRIDEGVDFRTIKSSGKVGIMITMQNSEHFRTPLDVDTFYQLGQRVSQLTYNMQNRIGAGFLENRDGGLSAFGGEIIKRMEQVGMVVDLSHCADQTTLDALAAVTRPPIFSHASSRALLPACMRCKTDDMLTKLAAKGGVVGVPMIRFLIRPAPPVNVEHVVDHIDHLIKVMGPQHVGIGSDMDMAGLANRVPAVGQPLPAMNQANFSRYGAYFAENGGAHVDGLNHSRRIFDVTEAMVRRKYSDATIKLVLGDNFARVMSQTWK
jgi:membrane dipeptidase